VYFSVYPDGAVVYSYNIDLAVIIKGDKCICRRIQQQQKRCGKCRKQNVKNKCSKCKHQYYCGEECQKGDWKRHKKECITAPKKKKKKKEKGSIVFDDENEMITIISDTGRRIRLHAIKK